MRGEFFLVKAVSQDGYGGGQHWLSQDRNLPNRGTSSKDFNVGSGDFLAHGFRVPSTRCLVP